MMNGGTWEGAEDCWIMYMIYKEGGEILLKLSKLKTTLK